MTPVRVASTTTLALECAGNVNLRNPQWSVAVISVRIWREAPASMSTE